MTRIHRSPDCGNSPKNLFVQELSISLALGQLREVEAGIAAGCTWSQVGEGRVEGAAGILRRLADRSRPHPEAVHIQRVLTHGKSGAVHGSLEFAGGERDEFVDLYEFTSVRGAQVCSITTFRVAAG